MTYKVQAVHSFSESVFGGPSSCFAYKIVITKHAAKIEVADFFTSFPKGAVTLDQGTTPVDP